MNNQTEYSSNTINKEQEQKIDTLFQKFNNNTPGCAVGIIQNGKFIYKKSFGMANLDYDIPINEETKFEISSISKQFTAACIAFLKLEGELDLDDNICKYIPELPDYGVKITIRHLIHHTSGISDYREVGKMVGAIRASNELKIKSYYSNKDGLKHICIKKSLDHQPNENHYYSNSNYLLLTEIIERISKISFAQYAMEKIFTPLKMYNSFINDNSKKNIKNRAVCYDLGIDNEYYNCQSNNDDVGAKGVVTTLNDLYLWNQNFYNHKVGGKKFINLLHTEGILNNQKRTGYCFGLRSYEYKNIPVIGHTGGVDGYRANMMCFPKQNTTILALGNTPIIPDDIFSLTAKITDIIFSKNISIQEKTTTNKIYTPKSIHLTERELEKICGHYFSKEGILNRKIYLKESDLYYVRGRGNESLLIPTSKNELIMVDFSVKLNFDLSKELTRIKFIENDICINELNKYYPVIFNIQYLRKYTGSFYCEELDIIHRFKIESDKLVLFIKDEKITDLIPIISDIFKYDDWCYEFKYDNNKIISKLELDSSRVKNIKFIKKS